MTDISRDLLRSRAEALLAEHASIKEAATALTSTSLDEDQRAILLRMGARALMSEIASADRHPIPAVVVTGAARKGKDDTAAFRSVANRSLLDTYRLCGGKPIGDATRADLIASAEEHEKLARGNEREARFQRAVAKSIRDGERVRDRVGEIDLRKMQAAARGVTA